MLVVLLFLAVPWICLQFVIVVFPDHTCSLFWIKFESFDREITIEHKQMPKLFYR